MQPKRTALSAAKWITHSYWRFWKTCRHVSRQSRLNWQSWKRNLFLLFYDRDASCTLFGGIKWSHYIGAGVASTRSMSSLFVTSALTNSTISGLPVISFTRRIASLSEFTRLSTTITP